MPPEKAKAIAPVVRTVITRSAKAGAPMTWEYFGGTLDEMFRACNALFQSGLLNPAIKSPQAAMVIVLKGRELGLPPMYALSHIQVISGKPVAAAEVLLALMVQKGVQAEWVQDDVNGARLTLTRWDTNPQKKPVSYTGAFLRSDAERATTKEWDDKLKSKVEVRLIDTGSYIKYPQNMFRARAITNAARAFAPDLIGGISYTAEELGAGLDDEGVVRIDTIEEVPQETVGDDTPATPGAGVVMDARKAQDVAAEVEANGGYPPAPVPGQDDPPAPEPVDHPDDPGQPTTGKPLVSKATQREAVDALEKMDRALAGGEDREGNLFEDDPPPAPAPTDAEKEAKVVIRAAALSRWAETIYKHAQTLGLARPEGMVYVSSAWAIRLGEVEGEFSPYSLSLLEEQGKGVIATLVHGIKAMKANPKGGTRGRRS